MIDQDFLALFLAVLLVAAVVFPEAFFAVDCVPEPDVFVADFVPELAFLAVDFAAEPAFFAVDFAAEPAFFAAEPDFFAAD